VCGVGDGIAPLWRMLLRVIAHQIACFASDRRALTVFCVTSVHFYAAFLLFAGRESGSGGPGGPRRPRVPRPAPPRQAPALTHTMTPQPQRSGEQVPQRTGSLFQFHALFLLFSREGSRPHFDLCETLFSHVFSAYSPPLFVTTVQHRHDVKSTSTAPLAPSDTTHHQAPLRFVDSCVYAVGGAYAETCVYASRCIYTPAAYTHQALA